MGFFYLRNRYVRTLLRALTHVAKHTQRLRPLDFRIKGIADSIRIKRNTLIQIFQDIIGDVHRHSECRGIAALYTHIHSGGTVVGYFT
ncbi:hypothetical protein D3C76_1446740 [compost metagenome]